MSEYSIDNIESTSGWIAGPCHLEQLGMRECGPVILVWVGIGADAQPIGPYPKMRAHLPAPHDRPPQRYLARARTTPLAVWRRSHVLDTSAPLTFKAGLGTVR